MARPHRRAGAPGRMVLACARPDHAHRFYTDVLGSAVPHTDFHTAPGPESVGWSLVVSVTDLDDINTRLSKYDRASLNDYPLGARRSARLVSPKDCRSSSNSQATRSGAPDRHRLDVG